MTLKQRLLVLFGAAMMLLAARAALADPIQLPNLSKSATGTSLGGGKYALDVNIPSGSVSVTGAQVIGGAYSGGDSGLTSLAVRKDAAGPLAGVADGDYTPLLVDSNGYLKISGSFSFAVNAGASFQEDSAVTTTPGTFTAPGDTIEILCQAPSSNTSNVRIKQGAAASSTSGIVLEPGRSETLHAAVDVSYAAESGTQALYCQFTEQN